MSKTTKKKTHQKGSPKKASEKIKTLVIQAGLIALSFFLAFSVLNEVRTYQNLKASISDNRRLLAKTKEEEEQLELTKRNLTNPDYLEFVARGRYYASRPGEQVFVFPDLAQEYSQADDEFYDDEILREEEANKKQSLQQAAQNNANHSTTPSIPDQVDSGLSDQEASAAPQEEPTSTLEESLEQPAQESVLDPSM